MAAATTDKLEAKSDMGCGKKDADKKDMMSVKRYSSKKAKMKPEEEEMREGEADKGDGYKNKMDKEGKACSCKHKNDSLTPQEYIAACEMGIQDRSRVYIRARLDAAERMDKTGTGKKCGNSYIPANANCTAGSGGSAPAKQSGKKAAKKPKTTAINQYFRNSALLTAGLSTARAVNQARQGKLTLAAAEVNNAIGNVRAARSFNQNKTMQGFGRQFAHGVLSSGIAAGGTAAGLYSRTPAARNAARRAGQAAGRAYGSTIGRGMGASRNTAFSVEQRMRGFRKMKRPNFKNGGLALRDSVWADGFSPANSKYDI